MPLVNAKCTNCGANLEVDSTKDAANCPYCGAAYLVEKAINNYNITNNTTNNINAEVVNVYGGIAEEFEISGGILKKYNGSSVDIIIPDSVKRIGNNVFRDMAITSVQIPEGVDSIGESAFSGCTGLEVVSCCGEIEWIGDHAFAGCTSLQRVSFLSGVRKIGSWVFDGCNSLQSVTISEKLEKIGWYAFFGCGITEIILPEGLQEIADYAFYESGITHLEIPQTVTSIGRQAFFKCQNLEEIMLPEGLINIGEQAFKYSGLNRVVIPESVQVIDRLAFEHCDSLKEITVLGNPKLKGAHTAYSDGCDVYPFECCDQLTTVNASEEWKKENRHKIKYLINYRPAGSTQSQGSCYIATAVYGSYDCPQVWTLRRYRDNYLAESVPGRLFIHSYYAISPTIVRWFKDKDWFQRFWRDKLDKKVYKLNQKGYKDTPYSDK